MENQAEGGEDEPTTNLFVGQLSWNVDNDWLRSEFEQFGTITGARVVMDRQTNRSKGMGFVDFEDIESAKAAVEKMNGAEVDGRPIRVNFAQPRAANPERRAQAFGDKISAPADTLYVAGLSYSLTEDQVYEAFGEHGDVQSVRLVTDRETGAPRGFGEFFQDY